MKATVATTLLAALVATAAQGLWLAGSSSRSILPLVNGTTGTISLFVIYDSGPKTLIYLCFVGYS